MTLIAMLQKTEYVAHYISTVCNLCNPHQGFLVKKNNKKITLHVLRNFTDGKKNNNNISVLDYNFSVLGDTFK